MKTFLHFLLAFTFGLLTAALIPILFFDASVEVQAQTSGSLARPVAMASGVPGTNGLPYELRGPIATATLPAGNDYYHIDAQVADGGTHGAPMVVGGPKGSLKERSLFMASENAGVMSFGAGMPAVTLWNYESGNDPFNRSIVNDLRHMPNGTPLLIGASSSPRAIANGQEATVWQINNNANGLVPVSLGFPSGDAGGVSRLGGGNSTDGYAGSNSADPIFVPPTGGGQTLDAGGVFRSGGALDLDGNTAVGSVEFHAAFWTKGQTGSWSFGNLAIPEWSDGTGAISDVADGKMGGYLYKPDLDDIVPVLWNTDGTLNRVFDLPGYSVAEMVVDEGAVVTLLNQGTDGLFAGPSKLYADGWSDSRLYFGDIVPALEEGTTGFVVDFSSGGSLWVLNKYENASGVFYGVTDVLSSAVPEPSTIAFLFCATMFGRSFRYLTAGRRRRT